MKTKILLTILIFVALTSLVGCSPRETTLSGADQETILAFSEAATDNLFAGLAANDYDLFARDFDAEMKAAMTESNFAALKENLDSKVGNYISRTVDKVTQSGEFYAVVYQAKFELEEPVYVRVVFRAAEPHSISGLWLDSKKLRQ